MKKFIITEEERRHIKGLYEQSNLIQQENNTILDVKPGDTFEVERYYTQSGKPPIKVDGKYIIKVLSSFEKDVMGKISGPKSQYNTNIDGGLGSGTYEFDLVQGNCIKGIPGGAPLGCLGHSYDKFKIIKK